MNKLEKTIAVCTRVYVFGVAMPLSARVGGATSSSNGFSADPSASNGFTSLSTAFPFKSPSRSVGNGVGTVDSKGIEDIILGRTRVAMMYVQRDGVEERS